MVTSCKCNFTQLVLYTMFSMDMAYLIDLGGTYSRGLIRIVLTPRKFTQKGRGCRSLWRA